ncbi:MAG TPA: SgcJ/EcaC family oxidoreductase [Vicinamibacterales bacterium]|nr:SgcJ/EcaC family oxidoreductase [Vicinamibacterales bacterium]
MRRIAVFALLAAAIGCAPAPPAANAPEDIAAINKLRDGFVQAFNAGDATAAANLYTADAISADNHQPTMTGRDAIVKNLESLFSAYTVKFTLTPDETKTMGDFAYDWGRFTFALTPKAEGVPAMPADQGRYLVLIRKDTDGQWRVARDIANSTLPMPTPAPEVKKNN